MCADTDNKILAMTNPLQQRQSLMQQDDFSYKFLYCMMNDDAL